MKDFKTPQGAKGRKPALKARLVPRKGKRTPLPRGFQPLPAPRPSEGPPRESRILPLLGRLKGRRPPVIRLLTGAALVWLALGAVVGGKALWEAPLSSVTLIGGHALTADDVVALAGLNADIPLAALDPYTVSQRVAAHPSVRKADVRRVFPGEMRITVEERLPTLRVVRRDGTVLLLDRENVVLGRLGTPGETNDPAPSADGEPAESGTSRSATLSEAMPVPLPVMANPAESLPTVTGIETREEANRVLDDPALRRGVMVLERLRGLRTEGGALGDMDLAQVVVEAGHPFMLRVRLPHGPTLVVPEDRAGPALATYIRLLTTQPALLEGSTVIDLSTLAPDGGGRVFLRPR